MSEQPSKRDWFYWFIAAFTAIQLGWMICLAIDFILHPWLPEYAFQSPLFRAVVALLLVPCCIVIAILVIRRAPGNVVGLFLFQWVVISMGTTMSADSVLSPYSSINLGWLSLWLLFLYFPNGRAFPYRFERIINAIVVIFFINAYGAVFTEPMMPAWLLDGDTPNHLYVAALAPLRTVVYLLNTVVLLGIMFFLPISIALRFLRSTRPIRQQMKWLGWVGVLTVISGLILSLFGINTKSTSLLTPLELSVLFGWSLFITLMPFIAVGNAILRHKLYDIDIIIRRTLIYTVLTTILGVVYFGSIVLTQQVFRAVTGQSSEPAIVVSTLMIAALFAPLRRRVQDVIDRRLYRKKYDAEKVLADFQKNLCDEVDMETLKANLIGVLQDTMQPTKIALWVKEPKS